MPWRAGRTKGGATATTTAVLSASNVLSGVAKNADGSLAKSAPVRAFLDGSTVDPKTATTDASTGAWSIANFIPDTNGHSYNIEVDGISVARASGVYVPSFKRVRFDGATYGRNTAGMNPSSDVASLVPIVSGGAVTGFQSGATGIRFEPGVTQTITKTGGAGTGFAATVTARADGRIYGEDVSISAGGSSHNTGSTFTVTRKVTKGIIAIRMMLGAIASNDVLLASGILSLKMQNTTQTRFSMTSAFDSVNVAGALNNSAVKTLILSWDMAQSTAAAGLKGFADNASILAASPTFNPGVLWDAGNVGSPTLGVMCGTGGANIAEGDVDFIYYAFGYDALSPDGSFIDISQQTIRDRFLPGNISFADGKGPTGRKPTGFYLGPAARPFFSQLGVGNAPTLTGTLTDVA